MRPKNEFSASDVCRIANVTSKNLQSWLRHDLVLGQGVEGGGAKGKHRVFSWSSVIEISLAAVLIDHGFPRKRAFFCALQFAHMGDHAAHWEGDMPGPMRHPGMPYHHKFGPTFLYVSGDDTFTVCEGVPGQSADRAVGLLGRSFVHTVIDISGIFDVMCSRMDLHPLKVLDETYGG